MPLVIDNDGTTSFIRALSTSPYSYTGFTMGSVSNGVLILMLVLDTGSITSVTWNGVSMTKIGAATASDVSSDAELWGLVNPAAGNQTAVISWSGGTNHVEVAAISYSGADQTGGATTFPTFTSNTGGNSPSSVTLTNSSGNAVVALHAVAAQVVSSVDNTQIFTNGSGVGSGANRSSVAGSDTLTATLTGNSPWVSVATGINAAVTSLSVGVGIQGLASSEYHHGRFYRSGVDHRWRKWRLKSGVILVPSSKW